jgi:polyisoprenoid-binding protein YceI
MTRCLCFAMLLFAVGPSVAAQETTLELDPASTRIEFTVAATLHTVHGTFALKSGTIQFNPLTGSASGAVVVDATSGDSGSSGRDQKMHKDILESQRYPKITFAPTKMSGKLEPQGESSVQVEGILTLHGSEHPISLVLPVRVNGNNLQAQTHILIPYVAWGLKNPSSFVLHVNDKVEINVTAAGHLRPAHSQAN